MSRTRPSIYIVGLALLAGILFLNVRAAWAGGWSVVTLDRLPTQVVAGQPVTIGFMVRQHGREPMEGLAPTIQAGQSGGAKLTAQAHPQGATGHYVATLLFPSAGTWQWSINAFGPQPQPMPALNVLAPASPRPATAGPPAALPVAAPLLAGIIGLAGILGAVLAWRLTRKRWAPALALLAALIATAGLASTASQAQQATSPSGSTDAADLGHSLFMAKGCVVCHRHASLTRDGNDYMSIAVGPDLTHLSADPAYLRRWLKNPSALKPGTQMPTLGLADDEIEALIAFLSQKGNQ